MRCKPGDLAIIVNTLPEYSRYLGKILTCVAVERWYKNSTLPVWSTEPKLIDGPYTLLVEDEALRPIRPDEGPDETLAWADVPKKATI